MHIVFFADQHLESLGGAQVSMRLQKRYLERAGHTVSVVAPRMHGPRAAALAGRMSDPAYIDTPSVAITPDREYSFTLPGRRTDRFVDRALRDRGPVDIVHVQADFWGALTGHRFAARHAVPLVHTMHNRVGVGLAATVPFPALALRVLGGWQRRLLGSAASGHDAWAYLAGLAAHADAVTAPSAHFARRLESHGVVPRRGGGVDVIWNGIDDGILDEALTLRAPRRPGPARFIWLGRMSPEKRLLPFLQALCDSGLRADVQVLGGGGQRAVAERYIERRAPEASVVFGGRMTYAATLRRIAEADAVVQTSIGFETQGMTVFEGASLGTPSIISDPDIGAELESGFWQVPDASTRALADTLARAASDIVAGTAPEPNPSVAERFRQSSRTAAMLAVYDRVRR
ncbi:glycosyltransferase family 4 protein [Microbacterium luticocti]|uniref:glycosyltransferase family 4 protein n=1 Tax=Microbacterium luticocti TaxID=451764 RepID=UPI00040CE154|nr:glycosyltransferase family 4 protein [Microbacterium luticocti]